MELTIGDGLPDVMEFVVSLRHLSRDEPFGRPGREWGWNLTIESAAERNRDGVLLLARILLAAIFVQSGFGKLMGFEGFAASLAAKGCRCPCSGPSPRWRRSSGAASDSLRPGDAAHRPADGRLRRLRGGSRPSLLGDAEHYQAQYVNFMKNIAIMGGYLALFVAGPGAISLDGWRGAGLRGPYIFTSSTRRFFACPSSLSLLASGAAGPMPTAVICAAGMP